MPRVSHALSCLIPLIQVVGAIIILVLLEEETGVQKQSYLPTVIAAVNSRAGIGTVQLAPGPHSQPLPPPPHPHRVTLSRSLWHQNTDWGMKGGRGA